MLWHVIKHIVRTSTKPYHVALGESIGDLVDELIAAYRSAAGDPTRMDKPLKRFEAAIGAYHRNNERPTFYLAMSHWAGEVASPHSLRAIEEIMADATWVRSSVMYLQQWHPEAGLGISAFQHELKTIRLYDGTKAFEAVDRLNSSQAH